MGILQAEYWSGLPFLPPRDLPNLGIEPESLVSPALAGGFFTTSTTWEVQVKVDFMNKQQSEYGPFTIVFQLPTIRTDRNLCPFWLQILSDSVQPCLCEPIPQLILQPARIGFCPLYSADTLFQRPSASPYSREKRLTCFNCHFPNPSAHMWNFLSIFKLTSPLISLTFFSLSVFLTSFTTIPPTL